MRLSTIWSLPAMTLRERFRRTGEWAAFTVAGKLPQRVRYWTTILEISKATKTSSNIPATTLDEVLQNLDGGKGGV